MNKTIFIIATLFIAALTSCAKPAPATTPAAQADKDGVYYGNAYGIKIGEDALKEGKHDLALQALNEGLWFLRKANLAEKCGTSKTRCIIYKIYGFYLRAMVHAMNDNADMALADLNWIHENGYMALLVKYYKFWNEPRFNSLNGNTAFQKLVSIYKK